jgi:hypothetical protein
MTPSRLGADVVHRAIRQAPPGQPVREDELEEERVRRLLAASRTNGHANGLRDLPPAPDPEAARPDRARSSSRAGTCSSSPAAPGTWTAPRRAPASAGRWSGPLAIAVVTGFAAPSVACWRTS